MRSALLTASVFVLALGVSHADAQSCTSIQPGADWFCVNGGWRPANQVPVPTDPGGYVGPKPHQPTPDVPFKIGRRYWRNASGVNPTDVYIAGAGQLADGTSVLFAVCRTVGDGCFEAGTVRLFLSNATAKGWEDRTDWPY